MNDKTNIYTNKNRVPVTKTKTVKTIKNWTTTNQIIKGNNLSEANKGSEEVKKSTKQNLTPNEITKSNLAQINELFEKLERRKQNSIRNNTVIRPESGNGKTLSSFYEETCCIQPQSYPKNSVKKYKFSIEPKEKPKDVMQYNEEDRQNRLKKTRMVSCRELPYQNVSCFMNLLTELKTKFNKQEEETSKNVNPSPNTRRKSYKMSEATRYNNFNITNSSTLRTHSTTEMDHNFHPINDYKPKSDTQTFTAANAKISFCKHHSLYHDDKSDDSSIASQKPTAQKRYRSTNENNKIYFYPRLSKEEKLLDSGNSCTKMNGTEKLESELHYNTRTNSSYEEVNGDSNKLKRSCGSKNSRKFTWVQDEHKNWCKIRE